MIPNRSVLWLGRTLIALGIVCLASVWIQLGEASSFQRAANQTLERALTAPPAAERPDRASVVLPGEGGTRPRGVVAGAGAPLESLLVGRLEIPRLGVSVVVMKGEDDETLARAVGHLYDTPLPWESGNSVLAGHRDTFFRPLRHIRDGDEITMTTGHGTFTYRVVSTKVVAPDDLSVLEPTPTRSLTLVTCYPFFYVGPAPKRFIVHAR